MNQNSMNDRFHFNFPSTFVPQSIEDKYKIYLENFRKPFTSVLDYINSTILDVNIPALTFPTVSQKTMYGKEKSYRGSKSPYDVYNRTFTINMKSVDDHLSYFMMEDILMYHFTSENIYTDDFTVRILDKDMGEMFRIYIRQIIPEGLSDLRIGNNQKNMDITIYTVSFKFNKNDKELSYKREPVSADGDIIEEYSDRLIKNDDTFYDESEDNDDEFIIGKN